jgi:hypothetical protein
MAGIGNEEGYERYGWMILSANAILGIFAAVLTSSPSIFLFSSPHVGNLYPILGALGTALVGFNLLALIIILVPYRRYERWAWSTLWMLPLQWISQFLFFPDLMYLMLAALTMVGLLLPYRGFFPPPKDEAARVR